MSAERNFSHLIIKTPRTKVKTVQHSHFLAAADSGNQHANLPRHAHLPHFVGPHAT